MSVDRSTGTRRSIDYSYTLAQFMNSVNGFNKNYVRSFINIMKDPSFDYSSIQIRNACHLSNRPVFARDNDVLKLAIQLLNHPAHVLVFEDVFEEEQFINALQKRFNKKTRDQLISFTFEAFDRYKFISTMEFAKKNNWSIDECDKLQKYIDCKKGALGQLIDYECEDMNEYTLVKKQYDWINLEYRVWPNEDLHRYTDVISDELCDYPSTEDYLLRYVKEKPFDEIFNYESFMSKALMIRNEYPELMDPNQLYDMDFKAMTDYRDDIFIHFDEPEDVIHEKCTYVDIIRAMKSLITHEMINLTKYAFLHVKYFSAESSDHLLTFDEFQHISSILEEEDW